MLSYAAAAAPHGVAAHIGGPSFQAAGGAGQAGLQWDPLHAPLLPMQPSGERLGGGQTAETGLCAPRPGTVTTVPCAALPTPRSQALPLASHHPGPGRHSSCPAAHAAAGVRLPGANARRSVAAHCRHPCRPHLRACLPVNCASNPHLLPAIPASLLLQLWQRWRRSGSCCCGRGCAS